MNLTACEYPESVDEFVKAGFTKEKASIVRPWLIKECPVKFECRVKEMRSLGNKGGAGMLCFAEVVQMHVDPRVLDEKNRIDPGKLAPVARLGDDHYIKVSQANLFKIPKHNGHIGIGFDQLPADILSSKVFTANHLGQLANVEALPELDESFRNIGMLFELEQPISERRTRELHMLAKRFLDLELVEEAWQVLIRVNMVLNPNEESQVIDRHD